MNRLWLNMYRCCEVYTVWLFVIDLKRRFVLSLSALGFACFAPTLPAITQKSTCTHTRNVGPGLLTNLHIHKHTRHVHNSHPSFHTYIALHFKWRCALLLNFPAIFVLDSFSRTCTYPPQPETMLTNRSHGRRFDITKQPTGSIYKQARKNRVPGPGAYGSDVSPVKVCLHV